MTLWKQWITAGVALLGAAAGAIWTNAIGAVAGAVAGAAIASLIPLFLDLSSNRAKLKRQIANVLAQHSSTPMDVREVMRCNGIAVPTDCFAYDQGHPFVRALEQYRAAFSELEADHQVVQNRHASTVIGYVDAPNDWVNDWAGRVYQHAPSRHV